MMAAMSDIYHSVRNVYVVISGKLDVLTWLVGLNLLLTGVVILKLFLLK